MLRLFIFISFSMKKTHVMGKIFALSEKRLLSVIITELLVNCGI